MSISPKQRLQRTQAVLVSTAWIAVVGCGGIIRPGQSGAAARSAVTGPPPDAPAEMLIGPADDTTLVMRAVGAQLRKDYRRATLYFSRTLLCGDEHPQPCQTSGVRDKLPHVIAVAMAAAGGVPQCTPGATTCSAGPDSFEIAVKAPMVFADSALVSVTAFSRLVSKDSAVLMTFERQTYRASKMSSLAWRVTARYLEATGAYEFPKPPRQEFSSEIRTSVGPGRP